MLISFLESISYITPIFAFVKSGASFLVFIGASIRPPGYYILFLRFPSPAHYDLLILGTSEYIKCNNFRRFKLSDKDLSKYVVARDLELSENLSRRKILHILRMRSAC